MTEMYDWCEECDMEWDHCDCDRDSRYNEDDERCERIRDDNRARLANIKGY